MDAIRAALQAIISNRKMTYTLVTLVVIGGFVILLISFGKKNPLPGEGSFDQSVESRSAQAIKNNDIDACNQLDQVVDGVNYKTVCRNNIALNTALANGDVSQCKLVDGLLVSVADCEFQTIRAKALKKESIAICDEATVLKSREQCRAEFVFALAMQRNDGSVCNDARDAQSKTDCLNAYAAERLFDSRERSADCSLFVGDDVQRDCNLYQDKGFVSCRFFESNLFSQLCARHSGI